MRALRWLRQHADLVLELAGYGFWLLVDLAFGFVGLAERSARR